MTPKEKAKEILWKYLPILESWKDDNSNKAKQCALIAVNEIIEFSEKLGEILYKEVGTDSYESRCKNYDLREFYKQVMQEIEKL